MNAKLALQIVTTIGYYKDGTSSTCKDIRNIWHNVFPAKDLPVIRQKTYMAKEESWINWDKAKLMLYEEAIEFLAKKLDK